jgi:rare lipoprotein A
LLSPEVVNFLFDRRPSAVVLSVVIAIGAACLPAAEEQDKQRVGTTGRNRTSPRVSPAAPAREAGGWTRGPRGFATYYAKMLDGLKTASGTTFDNDDMVAAHPTYAFGTLVRVTNLQNGRKVVVRVVDRGPTRSSRAKGNIIDLSRAAAQKLGFINAGRARVRLEFQEPPDDVDDEVVTSADGRRTEAEEDR